MSANRTVCTTHGQTNPCPGCAADHITGEHAPGTRKTTCRKCRAYGRAGSAPLLAAAQHRTTHVLDVAALAANDTELIEKRR